MSIFKKLLITIILIIICNVSVVNALHIDRDYYFDKVESFKYKKVITKSNLIVGTLKKKDIMSIIEEAKSEPVVPQPVKTSYNVQLERNNVNNINVNNYKDVYYDVAPGHLTASRGRVWFNGHSETYYAEEVLPGRGLRIPGRHVAYDGTIRDSDSYIVVAADGSYLAKGTIVLTSLGWAKVYDTGCAYGTIDIYVNAGKFRRNNFGKVSNSNV